MTTPSHIDLDTLREQIRSGGWTLFLDRDGVINRRKMGGYIQHADEMELLPGVGEAIAEFRKWVSPVVVVTNQRGIALGLMDEADLASVHARMEALLAEKSARLDAIFFCPDDDGVEDSCRKPGTKMPLAAKTQFPEIVFERCVMVGDTLTDMQMGKALGMVCIHVGPEEVPAEWDDLHLEGLGNFWLL